MRIALWGIGKTAEKYINQIKNLSDKFETIVFVDGNQKDDGNVFLWNGYRVVTPKMLPGLDIDYLCILSIWEWDIRQRIYEEKIFPLSKIVSLHEIWIMDFFGTDMALCYKNAIKIVHPMQTETAEMWYVYEYLKRNYSYVLLDTDYWKIQGNRKFYFKDNIKPIWILWLQGFEEAPELVKVCVHSIQSRLEKEEYMCLLDKNTIFDYIDLPDYIIEKWKKGFISNTHFSDLIRVRLLNEYGGIWIDATVYFTGDKLADFIKNSELFMFNIWGYWRKRKTPAISANWLISAQPKNKMLLVLEALLNEYWKKEDKIVSYYLFHFLWAMVIERFPDEWDQVEKVLRDPAQLLCQELACRFDAVRFEHLKKMSDIHKLSYKSIYTEAKENSFWAKICEIEGF